MAIVWLPCSLFFLFWITCWVLRREFLSFTNVSLVRFCCQCSIWLTNLLVLFFALRGCSLISGIKLALKNSMQQLACMETPIFVASKLFFFFLRHGSMNTAGVLLYALTCCKLEFREDFLMILASVVRFSCPYSGLSLGLATK